MTQKELAEKLNITDKAVSKWERGIGYPYITIISKLAEILSVTVNELLNGQRIVEELSLPNAMNSKLDYTNKVSKQRNIKNKSIVTIVVSLLVLISIFICTLCDLAISKTISWSIIPSSAIVLAWLIIIPIIRLKKNRLMISMISLSIFIIPFLWIIEQNTKGHWLNSVGIPIAIASLSYLWIDIFIFCYTKLSKYYGLSIAFIILPILDIVIDKVLGRLAIDYSVILTGVGCTIISIIFFYMGLRDRGTEKVATK
jgi:transcriptional regulator with XRE-family HTH domain